MMFSEDQLIPISALQHWLYCPRQYALIHLEQTWAENRFTAEGQVMHKNAHEGADETRNGIRITRGIHVGSTSIGITGVCDVVEFHPNGIILPIEYKRGKPKSHRADEVQLCAQALCLEEMLQTNIPQGCLFYGQNRRRVDVQFGSELKEITLATVLKIRACITSALTPAAFYQARLCDNCSLLEICMPQSMRFKKGAAAWFQDHLQTNL